MSLVMLTHCNMQTDSLSLVFKSRLMAVAMKVLGIDGKSGIPTRHSLPPNTDKLNKSERLDCLHELLAKVVDEFVLQSSSAVNALVDNVLTEQEKDILNQQGLTPEGRFPCRLRKIPPNSPPNTDISNYRNQTRWWCIQLQLCADDR